jgi:outer membrane protein assembly factor BamD (BamD/ComL family)
VFVVDKRRSAKIVLVMISLIVMAGCVPHPSLLASSSARSSDRAEVGYQNASFGEEKNTTGHHRLRKIAADFPQSPVAADALFEVAYLQTFYDNPQKDYVQALSGFEDFLKRYPDHAKAQDARNWRVILKTILDAGKENERLIKSIEELKKLDIRHEEQRGK